MKQIPSKSFIDLRNAWVVLFVFFFCGVLVYGNAIFHPFVHDDLVFIAKNPSIADLNFKTIFLQPSFGSSQAAVINTYYRPLLDILNRLVYQLFGFNPFGFHSVNVIIHIFNAFIFFKLIVLLCQKIKLEQQKFYAVALVFGFIFLLHPVQSEAVACISGISNLLSTLLFLLAFYFYLKTIENPQRLQRLFSYILSLIILFLSLLSKEQALVVPVIFLFCDILFRNSFQEKRARRVLIIAGYFLICILYLVLRNLLLGHPLTRVEGSLLELQLRLLSIPRMILTHLQLIFFPYGLHYYRCIDILLPKFWPWVIFLGLSAGVVKLIVSLKDNYRKLAVLGLGIFIISLLPTLNIIALVNEYSLLMLGEHFLYWPLIGFLIFLFAVISCWLKEKMHEQKLRKFYSFVIFLCCVYAAITIYQNNFWSSEVKLFSRTVYFEKNFARARLLLGQALMQQQKYQEAIVQYLAALNILQNYFDHVIDPRIKNVYAQYIKQSYLSLARCYEALGQLRNSLDNYQQAKKIEPQEPAVLYELGTFYLKTHDLLKAKEVFEQAETEFPKDAMLKSALAVIYQEMGFVDQARWKFQQVVELDPTSKSAKENLAAFLLRFKNK